MAFTITVNRGDTVTRTLTLTDANGAAYDLTGKTVTLDIAATAEDSAALLGKSSADASEIEHDDAGGVVSVHFVAGDYTTLAHTAGSRVDGYLATEFAATLRIDGDAVETGRLVIRAAVPAAA